MGRRLLGTKEYSAFSFVQGGLEIHCLVEVLMPRTIKNKEIISKYEELIEALYQEKDGRPVIESILVCNQPHEPADVDRKGTKIRRSHATMNPRTKTQKDNYRKYIRTFFKKSSTANEAVNTPKEANSVILID